MAAARVRSSRAGGVVAICCCAQHVRASGQERQCYCGKCLVADQAVLAVMAVMAEVTRGNAGSEPPSMEKHTH